MGSFLIRESETSKGKHGQLPVQWEANASTYVVKYFISFIFLKDFIYLLFERGEGREKERERNINV